MFKSTPPRLSDSELAKRAVEVLLNRVDGIDNWYYFHFSGELAPRGDLDLTDRDMPSEGSDLLERLKPREDGYWHRGPSPTPVETLKAVLSAFQVREEVARLAFKRIFDINVIENESDAFDGVLGWLNRGETRRRDLLSRTKLRSRKCGKDSISVVAEGDSWFQFPRIFRLRVVKDVIYHLSRESNLCLYTHAAGGDWLSNMLMSQQYVSALSKIEPDVFLFSGGGNDLVGGGRLGNMVCKWAEPDPNSEPEPPSDPTLPSEGPHRELADLRDLRPPKHHSQARFRNGLKHAAEEFFQFMNLVFVQYLLFIWNIRRSRVLRDMLIITQGYDHVIPKRRSTSPPFQPQRLVNGLMGSGKWLWDPLEKKRIPESDKPDVLYTMIQEFNEMLISLQGIPGLGAVRHVDSRGQAGGDNWNWFDEIHLKSDGFRQVADRYMACILENATTRSETS